MTTLAIFDANIFISYLLAPDEREGTIVRTFESISSGAYQLVSSDRLIVELRSSVDRKPYLRSRMSTTSSPATGIYSTSVMISNVPGS